MAYVFIQQGSFSFLNPWDRIYRGVNQHQSSNVRSVPVCGFIAAEDLAWGRSWEENGGCLGVLGGMVGFFGVG